jgi:hypothetical protein
MDLMIIIWLIEISALTTSANRQKEEIQHHRTMEKIEPKFKAK